MSKVLRAYRISKEIDVEIKRVAKMWNISEAEVINRSVPKFGRAVLEEEDKEGIKLACEVRAVIEGKEVRGGVGQMPTSPKPKIVMVAQKAAPSIFAREDSRPFLKPGAKSL